MDQETAPIISLNFQHITDSTVLAHWNMPKKPEGMCTTILSYQLTAGLVLRSCHWCTRDSVNYNKPILYTARSLRSKPAAVTNECHRGLESEAGLARVPHLVWINKAPHPKNAWWLCHGCVSWGFSWRLMKLTRHTSEISECPSTNEPTQQCLPNHPMARQKCLFLRVFLSDWRKVTPCKLIGHVAHALQTNKEPLNNHPIQ